MNKKEILEATRYISSLVGSSLSNEKPIKVKFEGAYGDYKWDLDVKAADIALEKIKEISKYTNRSFSVLTETYGWSRIENGKIMDISSSNAEDSDLIILIDEVEGTKNFVNDERYTTCCILDKPSLDDVIASSIYRWDGMEFYGYKNGVWRKDWKTEKEEKIKKAIEIDEVDSRVKVRGCFISEHLWMWDILSRKLKEYFNFDEKKSPVFYSDGTTTSDLLATFLDKSIVFEPRALNPNAKRRPFSYDIFPAAFLAKQLDVEIYRAEPSVDKNEFSLEERGIAFYAIPPGKRKKDIQKAIEEAVQEILDNLGLIQSKSLKIN